MLVRMNQDGKEFSGTGPVNATPAFGELILAGATPGVIATGSSAEVYDSALSTSGGCVAGAAYGVTQTIASGLLTIVRAGVYEVGLDLQDFSCTTATGNVAFDVQKNAAAIAGDNVMKLTNLAAVGKSSASMKRFLTLAKDDTIRVVVTAASTVVTVTGGRLYVKQIADASTLVVGA